MTKLILILLWAVFFTVLNIGSKILADDVVADRGFKSLAMSIATHPWTYAIAVLYVICGVLYMMLLRIMPVSIAGPVTLSLGIVLLAGIGAVVFKENIFSVPQMLGVAFCILGIVLLQLGVK